VLASFPLLACDDLTLRRVLPRAAAAIQEISYYDGVAAENQDQAKEMLARIDQDMARGDSLHWGVCLRGSAEIVGTCGFYRGFQGGVGEIGYVLRGAYRGRGVMTAAVRLVVTFGFETLNLDAVVAYTEATNEPSMDLLRRVGFVEAKSAVTDRKFTLTAITSRTT